MTSPVDTSFRSAVTSAVLAGGRRVATPPAATAAATTPAELAASVASLALSGTAAGNLTYGALASGDSTPAQFHQALTNAVLGGSDADALGALAALGATLGSMAQAAQTALAGTNADDRAKALTAYQTLYAALDAAAIRVNGQAGNAASLGLPAPGDWANAVPAVGTAAITRDMAAVVKAHAVVQQMSRSVGATWIASMLV